MITDYKPVQAMFNKTSGDLRPRIEKFIMDIQEYDYVVEYHPAVRSRRRTFMAKEIKHDLHVVGGVIYRGND